MAVRRWWIVGAGLAAAGAVGLTLGLWRSGESSYPAKELSATASLSPRTFSFADRVSARIDVLVDPRRIDPATVSVRPRFGLFRVLSSAVRTRKAGGVQLSYQYALECLLPGCLPGRTLAERRFLPALVSYRTAGRVRSATVDWPTYTVVTHLSTPDIGDPTTALRADAPLPAVSYRIAPGTLQALLTALAALLVLAAAGLVAVALPRRRAAAGPQLPPLEQALGRVRASTSNGHHGERRRALGRLARELRIEGRGELAGAAVRLAWSSEPPSTEATSALADEVEAIL
jgi:hypothetical protein